MFSQSLLHLATLAPAGTTVAVPSLLKSPHSAQICNGTKKADLLCYTLPDNTPQDVAIADVSYIAAYLRAYGAQTKIGRLYTMAAADAPDCAEWTVYSHGTVQVIAKHINNTVNTSVLYADIANTIDGGVGAAPVQQATALIGCGTNGGSLRVVYNASNQAYLASTYPAGYTPEGILIKIATTGA